MHGRIMGALIGAGAGDGMGAATEARTTEQITQHFGHVVTDFEIPPMDTFGAGNVAGQATDDFSSAYFLARAIVAHDGNVDRDAICKALVDWSEHAVFFDRFAGPTTRAAIRRFKGDPMPDEGGVRLLTRQATDGAGMRISPIGMLFPGDLDATIENAVRVAMATHDNHLAVSSACAVAAAVSEGLREGADLYSVLQAALHGAREGERIGLETAHDVAGPSIVRRVELAIQIGLGSGTPWEKMLLLGRRVGAGLHAAEAIPCAIGLVAANPGDAMGVLIGAANVGYDTDTVGTMAGAIAGALYGEKAFPVHFLPTLENANGFDITGLGNDLYKLAVRNMHNGGKA
ncbi:MAG: hypothetical protein EOM66_05480 [Clostridia bacterium]|nr:hypothetical protein [Clostridia bacterium]